MEYRMKILDKYINPIKNYQKTKEYRLYDEQRKKIKIGDTILLVSNKNNNSFIRVKIKGIRTFPSWEAALDEDWEKDFSFTSITYIELLKELQKYYRNDDVKKYGIVVYDIEPLIFPLKNSRVLIDTNTIIYRESHLSVNFEVAELYRWFDKLKMTKLIHPITKIEIGNYGNEELRSVMITKLTSYQEIVPKMVEDHFFQSIVNMYSKDVNSINDNSILLQVYSGVADYLVTNDKSLIQKAGDLYLGDRVFSIANFLKKIEDENPDLVNYNMLSVRLKKIGEIDLENQFFDTLREDYLTFNDWFTKKNEDSAYIFESNGNILGFLYLKIEDHFENYDDIKPKLVPKKRLKIGTFKIISSGFRLGERFLKIIFDNALENNVDEIYVTMFENKRKEVSYLKDFMMAWGFVVHGYKKEELVLIKDMKNYEANYSPKFNFPVIKKEPTYYFLPIYSDYHTDLFPDFILRNEDMNLYKDNYAHRYSIEKIYVSSAYQTPNPGDIVLIYRPGERTPKKYSSVVTGIAIIEEIAIPSSLEEYLKICSNKSVFRKSELIEFYNNKKWRKVIKLLNFKTFEKKVILDDLYKWGIIEKGSGPRPFSIISKENYDRIIKEGMVKRT